MNVTWELQVRLYARIVNLNLCGSRSPDDARCDIKKIVIYNPVKGERYDFTI